MAIASLHIRELTPRSFSSINLLLIGLAKYSKFPKLWMMKGQILYQMNDIANARKFYAKGLENCRDAIPLWLLLARLEEDLGWSD